jgi:hypothetical protein
MAAAPAWSSDDNVVRGPWVGGPRTVDPEPERWDASVDDVARYFGVSRRTVYNWIDRGQPNKGLGPLPRWDGERGAWRHVFGDTGKRFRIGEVQAWLDGRSGQDVDVS